nr:hypothetical protein [Plantactinospora sp. KBS50]
MPVPAERLELPIVHEQQVGEVEQSLNGGARMLGPVEPRIEAEQQVRVAVLRPAQHREHLRGRDLIEKRGQVHASGAGQVTRHRVEVVADVSGHFDVRPWVDEHDPVDVVDVRQAGAAEQVGPPSHPAVVDAQVVHLAHEGQPGCLHPADHADVSEADAHVHLGKGEDGEPCGPAEGVAEGGHPEIADRVLDRPLVDRPLPVPLEPGHRLGDALRHPLGEPGSAGDEIDIECTESHDVRHGRPGPQLPAR